MKLNFKDSPEYNRTYETMFCPKSKYLVGLVCLPLLPVILFLKLLEKSANVAFPQQGWNKITKCQENT